MIRPKPKLVPLAFLGALAPPLAACSSDSSPYDSIERIADGEGASGGDSELEDEGMHEGESVLVAEYPSLPVVPFGDVDGDGVTTAADLAQIDALVGSTLADAGVACAAAADLDHSGLIEVAELEAVAELLEVRGLQPDVFATPLHFVDEHCAAEATVAVVEPWLVSGATIHVAGISATTEVDSDSEGVSLNAKGSVVEVSVAPDAPGTEIDLLIDRGGEPYTLTLPLGDRFYDGEIEEPTEPGDVPPEDDPPPDMPPVPPVPPDTPDDCPQRGMGCSALLVNFFHNGIEVWLAGKAQRLTDEFQDASCEVHSWDINDHRRARFWPRRHRRCRRDGHRHTSRCYRETEAEYAARREAYRLAHMVPAKAALDDAIASFRASVSAGKEWTSTLVTAHGSISSSEATSWCGSWSNASGTVRLSRQPFHQGNYDARNKNTCGNSDVDISCGAGNTPDSVGAANNTGTASCGGSPASNCPTRAGYELDVAVGSSGRCESTIVAGIRLNEVDAAIESHTETPTSSFGSLLHAQGWATSYMDPGYSECL